MSSFRVFCTRQWRNTCRFLPQFFKKGWGKSAYLKKLREIRRIYYTDRNQVCGMIPSGCEVIIDKDYTEKDRRILYAHFTSPLSTHDFMKDILPEEVTKARIKVVLPKEWKSDKKRIVLHIGGTGDYLDKKFSIRELYMVEPLLEKNIGSIILENPFYGSRTPPSQIRSRLCHVMDLFAMGMMVILESHVILNWCKDEGFGPMALTGVSLGGYMASLSAGSWPHPIILVPCLSSPTASPAFTSGVLSHQVNWKLLDQQYNEDPEYKKLMKNLESPEEIWNRRVLERYWDMEYFDEEWIKLTSNPDVPSQSLVSQHAFPDNPWHRYRTSYNHLWIQSNLTSQYTTHLPIPIAPPEGSDVTEDSGGLCSSIAAETTFSHQMSFSSVEASKHIDQQASDVCSVCSSAESDHNSIGENIYHSNECRDDTQGQSSPGQPHCDPNLPSKEVTGELAVSFKNTFRSISREQIIAILISIFGYMDPRKLKNISTRQLLDIVSYLNPLQFPQYIGYLKTVNPRFWERMDFRINPLSFSWNKEEAEERRTYAHGIHSEHPETSHFMRRLMDDFTHLANYPTPVDQTLITAVIGSDDSYILNEQTMTFTDIWPEAKVKVVDCGHVSGVLRSKNRNVMIETIIESFEELDRRERQGKLPPAEEVDSVQVTETIATSVQNSSQEVSREKTMTMMTADNSKAIDEPAVAAIPRSSIYQRLLKRTSRIFIA